MIACSEERVSQRRVRVGKALKPVVIFFAAIYFLIDAIFFSLIQPLGTWLSKLPIFARIGVWIRSLGPYPTLALFAVPLIVCMVLRIRDVSPRLF